MVHKLDLFDPRFVSPLDVLVKNFFDQDAVFNKPDNRSVKHPVDVFEDENGLTFEVACTGLDKSDVDITIEGDILKIAYDKGEEKQSNSSPEFVVAKGGSWFTESDSTRSSSRRRMNISDRKDGVGLRLVWEPIKPLN